MSSLLRIKASIRPCAQFARAYASEDGPSPWFNDNKPGPYPKTEDEKIAAAKKYGLLREEYEPYPDDGNGYGDYPKLPPANVESRSPIYPWTNSYLRRNIDEVLHVDESLYSYGRITDDRLPYSNFTLFGSFFLFVGFFAFCVFGLDDYRYHHRRLEKQYPQPGVTHYLFGEESKTKHH